MSHLSYRETKVDKHSCGKHKNDRRSTIFPLITCIRNTYVGKIRTCVTHRPLYCEGERDSIRRIDLEDYKQHLVLPARSSLILSPPNVADSLSPFYPTFADKSP